MIRYKLAFMPELPPALQRLSDQYLAPAWSLTAPLAVTHGAGAYLFTEDGRKYLDFACGYAVTSTGHCHPRVVSAVQDQVARLIHVSTAVANAKMLELAKNLAKLTPSGLSMMFFHSTGAEVVEAAIKLSRYVTRRGDLIAFQGGFHGRTTGALALTSSKAMYRSGHGPLMPGVYIAPYPRFSGAVNTSAEACLAQLDHMFAQQVEPGQVAAMIVEPILGEGGYIDPPPTFLQGLRERCDEHGILLIADEIQSGVGRSGRWWAVEHAGVIPDLMSVAKGVASGFPLSVLVGKPEIMRQWPPGAHGTTFGGNPVSCAAALATLQAIEEERLVENAAARGEQLQAGLRSLQADHSVIGDVRGKGLMTGVEFVCADGSPNSKAAEVAQAYLLEKGVLISRCGPYSQTLRLAPPLILSAQEAGQFLDVFAHAVESVGK